MIDNLKNSKKAVGIKQSLKAVTQGSAQVVFIAKDADERVVSKIKQQCQKDSINMILVDNMKLLGKSCGIDVGAAVACILK